MKILEDLYCGNLISRKVTAKSSLLYETLRSLVLKNDDQMKSILTQKQKELFEKC